MQQTVPHSARRGSASRNFFLITSAIAIYHLCTYGDLHWGFKVAAALSATLAVAFSWQWSGAKWYALCALIMLVFAIIPLHME